VVRHFFSCKRAYFSRSAENRPVLAVNLYVQYFQRTMVLTRYQPGSHCTSLTMPAKCNLPFLHAGQLGRRQVFISSLIPSHTVSRFSQTRSPSSSASSFLFSA